MSAPGSPARVSRPLTSVADHTLCIQVEEGREKRARTHSTSTSVDRSSAEKMAKLNSFSLLSCSGKLYIQLYPSNPTVTRCDSRADFDACPCCGYSVTGEPFGTCPCSGYSATAGSLSVSVPVVRSYRGAGDYLTTFAELKTLVSKPSASAYYVHPSAF